MHQTVKFETDHLSGGNSNELFMASKKVDVES